MTEHAFVTKHSYEDYNFIPATYTVKILLNEVEEQFTRKVYSFLNMLGDIGAVSGALGGILYFFSDFYNASMFEDALIKTLFKF